MMYAGLVPGWINYLALEVAAAVEESFSVLRA